EDREQLPHKEPPVEMGTHRPGRVMATLRASLGDCAIDAPPVRGAPFGSRARQRSRKSGRGAGAWGRVGRADLGSSVTPASLAERRRRALPTCAGGEYLAALRRAVRRNVRGACVHHPGSRRKAEMSAPVVLLAGGVGG